MLEASEPTTCSSISLILLALWGALPSKSQVHNKPHYGPLSRLDGCKKKAPDQKIFSFFAFRDTPRQPGTAPLSLSFCAHKERAKSARGKFGQDWLAGWIGCCVYKKNRVVWAEKIRLRGAARNESILKVKLSVRPGYWKRIRLCIACRQKDKNSTNYKVIVTSQSCSPPATSRSLPFNFSSKALPILL